MAMMRIEELPISVQTLYADLVQRVWSGDLPGLMSGGGGSSYSRKVKGRLYWYWQPPTNQGKRASALYIGPENERTSAVLELLSNRATSLRERSRIVRACRAASLPVPDAMSGDVMAAVAEAGVFRQKAAIIGSVAFQSYPAILGFHAPAFFSRSGNCGIREFRSIAMAVEHPLDGDLESILKKVDKRFEFLRDPTNVQRTQRYSLRVDGDERFSVDVLSRSGEPVPISIGSKRTLRGDAQAQRYLDFLLVQEINSVALHRAGIPINVPDPTRYALHRLIVSQLRPKHDPHSRVKSHNDLHQAQALIKILARQRPDDLKDLWRELCERGSSWREKALVSLAQMPNEIAIALGEVEAEGH